VVSLLFLPLFNTQLHRNLLNENTEATIRCFPLRNLCTLHKDSVTRRRRNTPFRRR